MSAGVLAASHPDESFLVQCISPSENISVGNIHLVDILESMNESGMNLINLPNNRTYVFTIPQEQPPSQRKCHGTVQYIELCYEVMDKTADRMKLNFLSQITGENGDSYSMPIELSIVPSMNICFDETGGEDEDDTSMSKDSKIRAGLRRLFCWFCFWCSCHGESDGGDDSEETAAPPVCCARTSLDANITIPSSGRSQFSINNNSNISILGFTSIIHNCTTTRNCSSSALNYVPLIRFFVGKVNA